MKNKISVKVTMSIIIALLIGFVSSAIIFSKTPEKEVEIVKEIVTVNEQGETLDNFTKKGAVDALTLILNELQMDIEGQTSSLDERVDAALKGEDVKVVSDEVLAKIQLADALETDSDLRTVALVTLLTSTNVITSSTGQKEIKPMSSEEETPSAIYFDTTARMAHIPMDIFVGRSTGITYDMIYIDGEWKVSPYSIVISMKLIDIVDSNRK